MTINVQVVPENSLKTLPLWLLFRTSIPHTVKKPTRLKYLRTNQCSSKSFFSAFSTKTKLIDDSFEHSSSHLCLKTVHLALHREATQQKSPQYPFSFPGKQKLPYDKLTIFTRSSKKHLQQLVSVFRQL